MSLESKKVSEVNMKNDIFSKVNNTYMDYQKDMTIMDLFEEQVRKSPDKIALEFNNEQLTYSQLNSRVNKAAKVIRDMGAKRNDIIAVIYSRSMEMVIAILSVLKAGGVYLPIDSDYPLNRVKYILDDSGSRFIITNTNIPELCDNKRKIFYIDSKYEYQDLDHKLESVNDPDDGAYIIYTSGSTGNPKGVMVSHKSVNNLINGIAKVINFSQGKAILALTTISFDIFVVETLVSLCHGLKVVIASQEEHCNPKLLEKLIIEKNIDIVQATPSRLQLIESYTNNLSLLKNVGIILVGGEKFSETLLNSLKSSTNARIYNGYGPTEATVYSTVKELTNTDIITEGTPLANTRIYILDEKNGLKQAGEVGELCIAGDGVAKGYLNREELNQLKFVKCSSLENQIIYKTGDLAKLLPNGEIEILGRIDNQVKIRGFRVEIQEIESHIIKYNGIKQAVVIVDDNKNLDKKLTAFYKADEELNQEMIRNYLLDFLPEYMIPSIFIKLDSFPITPNGKIDRKNLSYIKRESSKVGNLLEQNFESGNDIVEEKIRIILQNNINIEYDVKELGLDEDISVLGLNSISFIKVVTVIEMEFGFEYEDEYLNGKLFPNLKSVVEYVKSRIKSEV